MSDKGFNVHVLFVLYDVLVNITTFFRKIIHVMRQESSCGADN